MLPASVSSLSFQYLKSSIQIIGFFFHCPHHCCCHHFIMAIITIATTATRPPSMPTTMLQLKSSLTPSSKVSANSHPPNPERCHYYEGMKLSFQLTAEFSTQDSFPLWFRIILIADTTLDHTPNSDGMVIIVRHSLYNQVG